MDPVLRNNIWDHLVNITKLGKKTVIITTHYIEETRQAHVVSQQSTRYDFDFALLVVATHDECALLMLLRFLLSVTRISTFSIQSQIGLMRGGKFLAEESPANLLLKYQCESLEDVFLKLAVLQNMGKRRRSSIAQEIVEQVSASQAIAVSQTFISSPPSPLSILTIWCYSSESSFGHVR